MCSENKDASTCGPDGGLVPNTDPEASETSSLIVSKSSKTPSSTPNPSDVITMKHPIHNLPTLSAIFFTLLSFFGLFFNLFDRPLAECSQATRNFDRRQSAQRSADSSNATVRFLSLNAFVRPLLVGVNDFKDQRLADLLPVLQPDDVVCLQELFWTTGPRKQRFLNALVEEGLIHYASSPIPYLNGLLHWPPKIIDAGLVIASRRPIIETDYFTFSRASVRSIDIIVAKGVLYARICIFGRPQKYAHVFTMHLQANNGLEDEPFDEIRRSQLEEIVSFVKDKTSDDPLGTIILAGDFNVDARKGFSDGSSSEEYNAAVDILKRIRTEEVLNDVLFQANGEHPVTSAGGLYGKTGKRERLDYIFMLDGGVSGDVNVCVRNGSVAVDELSVAGKTYSTMSDHYAVKADFVFERGTEG